VALQRATEESVAKEEALRRARALGLVQASEIAAQQDQTLALLLAREAAGISREPDVMKRLRAAVHESRERAILGVEGAMIEQARISPRGDLVAAALSDGTVRLWTLAGEPRAILTGHSARVVDVSFSAGGDRLLSTSLDGTARLWGTDGQLRAILRDPAEELATARFADSGKCILTLSAGRTRGKPALGVVRVWDADGKEGRPLGDATSPQVWAAFLPGSEKVLTMDASGTLTLWFPGDLVGRTFYSPKDGNATGSRDQRVFCAPNGWHVLVDDSTGTTLLDHEGHRLHRIPAKSDRRECVFSPDGSRFAIWQTLNADDFFVEPLESQVRVSFNGHRDEVTDVAFSPDGSLLVSASSDHTAIVWRPDGTPRLVLRGHRAGIESVAFSPDGSTVLSFSRDGTARLWDVVSGELGACMADVSSSASEPTISPSGETVLFLRDRVTPVIAGLDGVVRAELPAQPDAVETACFSPDGRRLLVLCKDGSCGLWDLEGKPLASLREGGETVRAAAFHPGEGTVVTGTEAGAVRIWNSQGTLQRTLSAHGEPILRVEFSRGSRDLLTISRGGFRVWGPAELAGGARAGAAFEGEFSSPRARHLFSPGGDRLLTSTRLGEKEDQVCLWMRGRPAQGLMRARRTWPFHWAFSPDGSMAAVFEGATVMVHDRNWRLRASFESASTDGGLLQDLSFMPSGAALLTGGWGGRACLWDLDGNLLAVFRGISEWLGWVGSFASGERVVTCSDDRTVRIWDTSGKEIDVLEGHGAGVREFLLSPDMSRLLAVDRSGEIRVWTLRADELLSIAGRRTCRDFEGEELTRYADILGPQFASRRERFVRERRARNLVDFVSRMTPLAADAVEILRERQGVEPEVREIALKIAATLKDDARRLNSEAWGRTWHGDSGPEDVRKALRWAEAAVRLAPEDGQVLNTLGVARYRAGEYPAALETLRRSDGLNGGKEEADAAFLAMALHRLGKPEEARAEMARLRALLKDEQKAAMYAGSRSFIDEAVEVVEGGK
jgi:WD40 repeat protein